MQAVPRPVRPEAEPKAARKLPLVVDLDDCLVRADLDAEAAIARLEARVRSVARTLTGEKTGIAAAEIAEFARKGLDVATLPLDQTLVDYIVACHETGRDIHLVTSRSQEMADAVAARLGVLASATGVSRARQDAGAAKLAALRSKLPGNFAYAGHEPALLAAAEAKVLTEARIGIKGAGQATVEAELARPVPSLKVWLRALRLHQWAKNGLLFLPLLLAHAYFDVAALARCAAGFVLLGFLASGTYLINDILDLDADRRHPTKRNRPLARGDISAGTAVVVAICLIVGSLAAAAWLSQTFLATLTGYLVLTLAYSLYLKRQMLIDVFVLACLFTSRIAMGIALAGVAASSWLLTFTMFFFLSLSLAKRHVEVVGAVERGLKVLPGRDYRASDLPLTVALGVGCNAVAMLVLFLYLTHDAMPTGLYRQPYWLWGAAFIVFLWSLRIWGLSHRGRLDADPVAFAIKDPFSIALGVVVAGVFALAH